MDATVVKLDDDPGIMGPWSPCRPTRCRGRAGTGVDVPGVPFVPEPFNLEYLVDCVDLVVVDDDRRDRHAC